MKKFRLCIVIFCIMTCFSFLSIRQSQALNITFSWGMEPAQELAGFMLYQRKANETYDYSSPVAVIEDPNSREYTLQNISMSQGINYYWVLRAYDIYSCKTDDSNEVRYKLLPNAHEFKIDSVEH